MLLIPPAQFAIRIPTSWVTCISADLHGRSARQHRGSPLRTPGSARYTDMQSEICPQCSSRAVVAEGERDPSSVVVVAHTCCTSCSHAWSPDPEPSDAGPAPNQPDPSRQPGAGRSLRRMTDFEDELRSTLENAARKRKADDDASKKARLKADDERTRRGEQVRAAAGPAFEAAKRVLSEQGIRAESEAAAQSLTLSLLNVQGRPTFSVKIIASEARISSSGGGERRFPADELTQDVVQKHLSPWLTDVVARGHSA